MVAATDEAAEAFATAHGLNEIQKVFKAPALKKTIQVHQPMEQGVALE
jgi:hypothetical protein